MLIEDLRESRRQKMARQIALARSTIREQRGDIARIVSGWSRIAKRINLAMVRYERVIDEIGLTGSIPLQPIEMLDCLKTCQNDVQIAALDELDEMLKGHSADLKKAARASARGRATRAKKRVRKAERRAKKRAKART